MVAAKGCETWSATISAPVERAKEIPALADYADNAEPSVGINILLNIMAFPPKRTA
jgi:hypothetical protein